MSDPRAGSTRRHWRAVAVLLLALTATTAGCADGTVPVATGPSAEATHADNQEQTQQAEPPDRSSRSGPVAPGHEDGPIVVIGDSITFITTDELTTPRSDRTYEVRAALGATSLQMLDDASRMVDADPAQVIINVGTNDAFRKARPEDTVAVVDEMTALFPDARCIHLTTINELMLNAPDSALASRVREINAGLRRLAERPRVDLIEWNELVQARAADGSVETLLSDTVHPTEEGQALLAQLYRRAVDGCDPGQP